MSLSFISDLLSLLQLSLGIIRWIVDKFLNSVDKKINKRFKNGVESPTRGKKKFNSNGLITSLCALGIPFNAGLKVLGKVQRNLRKMDKNRDSIKTEELRRFIKNALYQLDSRKYGQELINNWAESYVKKYGDPSMIPKVKYNDKRQPERITYKFIKKSVIPDVIKIVSNKNWDEVKWQFTRNDLDEISKEIMTVIKSLCLYEVNYDTILKIAEDLSLLPPHPWLVKPSLKQQTINYNLHRANNHLNKINRYLKDNNKKEIQFCILSINECIYHLSASILAYYTFFIGYNLFSPFNKLKNSLNSLNNNQDETSIKLILPKEEIINDLQMVNIKISEIADIINKLHGEVECYNHKNNDKLCVFYDLLKKLRDNIVKILKYKEINISNFSDEVAYTAEYIHGQ